MDCDCIEKVNVKLAQAGHDYKVATALVFDDKMRTEQRLEVSTYWSDPLKRSRKKPPSILCTYCPFCGNKAVADPVEP